MLRDIRIYFFNKFQEFVQRRQYVQKNITIKMAMYPLLVREFIKSNFSNNLRQSFLKVENPVEQVKLIKQLYFTFGCFLKPKQMMRYIELEQ